MTTKGAADDLFGGLSDSDNSDNENEVENEKSNVAILQDLEMSSEDEQTIREDSQRVELSPNQSMESVSQEDYQEQHAVSNQSENGYSSSAPTVSSSSSFSSYYNEPIATNETTKSPDRNYDTLDVGDPYLDETQQMEIDANANLVQPTKNSSYQAPQIANASMFSSRSEHKAAATRRGSSFTDKSLEQNTVDTGVKEEVIIARELLIANLTREQLDRYEAFRKSKFRRQPIKNIITEVTGSAPTETVALAISALAKMFIGEIVEEAVEIRDASNEGTKPIQPHHVNTAFKKLYQEGKLWPPYGQKY
ncbi:Protein CBR-TAF-11.3 [Caenorhabditis briggsae]|nr:Protein CBR-TAF-11.3 [Caenorhabditis briggsae]ULT99906.1 hypothetical protein L3Y34_000877 [Caenorhabditis briggsae]UMM22600.1 hypothetical protein L5515_003736 [Caenorhabditis briggsae]CAP35839.2 Protein CBR-TAF-11.3 [Caenorhabditis briggsae]